MAQPLTLLLFLHGTHSLNYAQTITLNHFIDIQAIISPGTNHLEVKYRK